MSKAKKRRTKKYQPREVSTAPLVYSVIEPPIGSTDLDHLEIHALSSLRQIEAGKGTPRDIRVVATVIDHMYVLSAAFNEKDEIRTLCRLAHTAAGAAAAKVSQGKVPQPCITHVLREGVRLYRELASRAERKELVEVGRVAYRHFKEFRKISDIAFVLEPQDENTSEDLTPFSGKWLTLINGKVRTGYPRYDAGRDKWVWQMPEEQMQAVINEPIFVSYIEDHGGTQQ